MIDRRELLALGGMLGGLAARGNDAEGAAIATADVSDRTAQEIAQEIANGLRAVSAAINAGPSFGPITPLRTRQIDHLKVTNKFPDFIDVGTDIWMGVYDWHIRLQQPIVLGRDPVGRYMLLLGFTQLVLRPDFLANYISVPYDASDRSR